MSLLYVIGEPGVGKSTTIAFLLNGLQKIEAYDETVPYVVRSNFGKEVCITLGKDRDDFPGTDTLKMNILPEACEWIKTVSPERTVIGEGDRLAHPRFWNAAKEAGHQVRVVALITQDPGTAAKRRKARGSNQDASWLKSRGTRVDRLISSYPVKIIEASGSIEEIAKTLSQVKFADGSYCIR